MCAEYMGRRTKPEAAVHVLCTQLMHGLLPFRKKRSAAPDMPRCLAASNKAARAAIGRAGPAMRHPQAQVRACGISSRYKKGQGIACPVPNIVSDQQICKSGPVPKLHFSRFADLDLSLNCKSADYFALKLFLAVHFP